jgi:predicted phage tail protein
LGSGADGRATLSWEPPTENTDGTALTDLASYRILYGRSANNLSKTVQVSNPSVTSYVVENLPSGKWYFAVVAVNNSGMSSTPSNVAAKTIS